MREERKKVEETKIFGVFVVRSGEICSFPIGKPNKPSKHGKHKIGIRRNSFYRLVGGKKKRKRIRKENDSRIKEI